MKRRRGERGLTLIEVMVALTIFALLSAVAYRGLGAVLDARARVDQETRKWRELTIAFVTLQQSFAAAVDRPVRGRSGSLAPAYVAPPAIRGEEPRVEFTRTGFPGHAGALADLQRVGYRLRGGQLEHLIWPALDPAPGSEPQASTLVRDVAALELRFLSRDGAWNAAWPRPGDDAALPRAIEVTLRLASGEAIRRLFALP